MTELVHREMFTLIRWLEDAAAVTPTSFSLAARTDLSFEQFEAIGVFLSRLHDGTKFWIGDWVLEGEARYGDLIYQAAEALGRSERTLANWAWTCRQVPRSRRRENLTFSHHVLVAPLEPEERHLPGPGGGRALVFAAAEGCDRGAACSRASSGRRVRRPR